MRKPYLVGSLVAVLLLSGTVLAQSWGSISSGANAPGAAPRQLASMEPSLPVLRLLAKPVEGVQWDEITFDEVLDWLRDESDRKVNIIPRWPALAVEGIDQDRTVTLELNDTTVGEILTETIGQIDPNGSVTFRGERNTLRISTVQDFDRKLQLRVYSVTDVLFRIPDFSQSAPAIDLQKSSQSRGGGGGGGGGRSVFANAGGGQSQDELSEDGDDEDPEEILEALAELIRDTIEPLSWEPDGGANRVRGYGKRSLVILAPISVHEQIAGFFSRDR